MAFTINPRRIWGALAAKYAYNLRTRPVRLVYIHHGATHVPFNLMDEDGDGVPDGEEATWKQYQRFHMTSRGWSDIAYNFGVGQSGSVLEGRGWLRIGGATGHPDDSKSLAICAIGNFEVQRPTEALIQAIAQWIITGIELGHIHPDAEIRGHRDKPYGTSCPGKYLYAELPKIRSMVADGRVSTEDTMDTPLSELNTLINQAPDGEKNEAIRLWQVLLAQQGYLAWDYVDGIKGPLTRAAQKNFETEVVKPETPNEIVGDKAWKALLDGPVTIVEKLEDLSELDVRVQQLINAADHVQDEMDRLNG